MALNGIQIFKLTPKKNCKECGCPTCMAFSMKVAQGAMKIEQCPHMSEDALASLSEATAPPMKTIKIGTGDGEFTLGGETVLFRHEKTFVSKTRYAVSLCTCMSDEEVEAKLNEAQEQNAREINVEDRAVQDGDIITLNYAGTVDGVAFDGGTAENQQLVIGSHTFIDNFEEQLIGVEIGGEKDVEVTFPEEYHAPDLAGKAAVFHVEVLGIKEKQLPEIDDDFAQDTTEFDTLEDYKNDIKEKLATAKEEQAKSAAENALIEQIVESSEMDIPDAMVDFQVDQMVDEFKQRLSYQGLSLEQYVQFSGQNMDALRENMKGDALKRVQGSLVLEAIVAAENIEANEEDLKKEFEKMAQMYQMEASQIEGMIPEEQKENMKKDIAVQKAVEFVLDQANVTEATEELDFEEK
mgnify:CR=1 FL=1